jgi:hypothetical protein
MVKLNSCCIDGCTNKIVTYKDTIYKGKLRRFCAERESSNW